MSRAMQELIDTVERFRGEGGCAWFEEQTHQSLTKYLIEECAELIDAIETGSDADIEEELGDVLFQVLFHANIAAARGAFTLDDVANAQREKLLRRNPHVFGSNPTRNITEIIRLWEAAKAVEKQERTSVLDGIARAMPALALAEKVLSRGEQLTPQLAAAPQDNNTESHAQRSLDYEIGERLLAEVAAARAQGIDAEHALREAVRRLEGRIRTAEANSISSVAT